jgi:hypothetical protein
MSNRKVTTKEATYRQWFASKYGNQFENHEQFNLPNTIANLDREWQQDMGARMPVSFNFSMDKLRMIQDEVRANGNFELHLDVINAGFEFSEETVDAAAISPANTPGSFQQGEIKVNAPKAVEMIVEKIDDMEFPQFQLHRTGTVIDKIMSDHTEEGGLYGGTVTIVTGESGVGKSTLLVDYLSKVKKFRAEENKPLIKERVQQRIDGGRFEGKNPKLQERYVRYLNHTNELKILYISTEMTKNDIYFYKQKMPQIGSVPTLLAMNYIKGGLKEVVTQAFETQYDIILLDSYQDLVEKLKDMNSWKATYAGNFLINLMVESAERRGTAIFAIQHLTKGGDYVGSTFLKHTTTAMLELRFEGSNRYAEYSKNRRGGSQTHKPVFFTLKNNQVEYDEDAFNLLGTVDELAESESEKNKRLDNKFAEVFNFAQDIANYNSDEDE